MKAEPDRNFHIFLCIGQSNMVGQPAPEAQDFEGVSDNFLSMSAVDCGDRAIGLWRKALPPLCHCNAGLSPCDYFGRTMLQYLPEGHRVGVINVAVNGCSLSLFDKDHYKEVVAAMTADWQIGELERYDANPWDRLIHCARLALNDGVIEGIIVQQGESDAYSEEWYATLKKVYDDICAELGLGGIPMTVGEALGNGARASANIIISEVEANVPNTYLVKSDGCTIWPDDGMDVHFDSASQRTLGRRHAIRMLSALGYIRNGYEND